MPGAGGPSSGRLERVRRFAAIFGPLALLGILALGFLIGTVRLRRDEVTALRQRERLRLNAEIIGFSVKRFATDARLIAEIVSGSHPALAPEATADPGVRASLERTLLGFARSRGDYVQVRLLSPGGAELIRINRAGARFEVVPVSRLQDKSDRTYVPLCRSLEHGQVRLVGPDLNREAGHIEVPWNPVLRVCTPCAGASPERRPLVILNFPVEPFVSRLAQRDEGSPDRMMIADAGGSWIRGPEADSEWGADRGFPAGTNAREWGDGALGRAAASVEGRARVRGASIATLELDLAEAAHVPAAGIPVAVAPSGRLTLASLVPDRPLLAPARRTEQVALLALAGYLLGSALLAVRLSALRLARREAALELARREEQLRDFLDASSDLVQSVDEAGRLTFVNRAWSRTLGWSFEEAIGRPIADVIAPESLELVLDVLASCLKTGLHHRIEAVFHDRGGRRVSVVGTVSPRLDAGRRVTRGFFRDVTEESAARAAQQAAEERNRSLYESGLALMCRHDLEGRLIDVNPAAAAALGHEAPRLAGRSMADLVDPAFRDRFAAYLERVRREAVVEGDLRVVTARGEVRTWHFRNRRVESPESGAYVLGSALDVTERRLEEEQLARQASQDQLTGLANRGRFLDQLRVALAANERLRHTRDPRAGRMAVGLLDLDGFKALNDARGHATGDGVLRSIGRALTETLRRTDFAARLGGDEFALILDDAGSSAAVERIARKILAAVEAAAEAAAPGCGITGSLGIVRVTERFTDAEALVHEADLAMYEAKREGAGRYCCRP